MTSILYSKESKKIVLSILFYAKHFLLHVYILSMMLFCYDNVLFHFRLNSIFKKHKF